MDKKIYVKPAVVTCKIALGVFGNNADGGGGGKGGNGLPPLPISSVADQKLRME